MIMVAEEIGTAVIEVSQSGVKVELEGLWFPRRVDYVVDAMHREIRMRALREAQRIKQAEKQVEVADKETNPVLKELLGAETGEAEDG